MLHPPLCPGGWGAVVSIDWCIIVTQEYGQLDAFKESSLFVSSYSLSYFVVLYTSLVAFLLRLLLQVLNKDKSFDIFHGKHY